MWDKLEKPEHTRCIEYLEKLIRTELPRLDIQPKAA
jgi:hypothetical protein